MRYWLDTEFIEDGRTIDLVSVGIVAEDGRELYLQRDTHQTGRFDRASDWVWRNVIVHLSHFNMATRHRSCRALESDTAPETVECIGQCSDPSCPWVFGNDCGLVIKRFCDPEKFGTPEFWGYYADYDWVAICQQFGKMIDLPKGWPMYCRDVKQLADELGNIQLPQKNDVEHHALADARWTRDAWNYLQRTAQVPENRR